MLTPAEETLGPVGLLEAATGTVRRASGNAASLPAGPELRLGDSLEAGWELVTGPRDRGAIRLTRGTSLRLDVNTRVRLVDESLLSVLYPAGLTRPIQLVLAAVVVVINVAVYWRLHRRIFAPASHRPGP